MPIWTRPAIPLGLVWLGKTIRGQASLLQVLRRVAISDTDAKPVGASGAAIRLAREGVSTINRVWITTKHSPTKKPRF
ncbi:hypothetical protein EMIT0P44_30331 [Pseudomonas sp. IT-P44]